MYIFAIQVLCPMDVDSLLKKEFCRPSYFRLIRICLMSIYFLEINMTTPDPECFLVFLIWQFFASKRPGLKDFCSFFEMEESWASEVTNYIQPYLFFCQLWKIWQIFVSKRPDLKDFCLLFEMEEWWASEAHKIKIVVNEIFNLRK